MKNKKRTWSPSLTGAAVAFICLQTTIAPLTGAIEISLEENRGERGSVGYVDIERVFKEYPETLKAREDFQAQIRKKEKGLNEKKAEIFALKAEIARLKQEKEFALRFPVRMEQPLPAGSPAPGISTSVISAEGLPGLTTASASVAVQESSSPALSTVAVQGAPAPEIPASSVSPETLPGAVIVSTPAPSAEKPAMEQVMDLPGVKSVPVSSVPLSVSTAAAETDAIISGKETELAQKEKLFSGLQRQVERELLDYESRKTEIILGKIYQFMRSLAAAQGISVVVDKRSILYGQSGVDLTDKLIKRLRKFY